MLGSSFTGISISPCFAVGEGEKQEEDMGLLFGFGSRPGDEQLGPSVCVPDLRSRFASRFFQADHMSSAFVGWRVGLRC